jgi:hypothetical protein
MPAFNQLDWEWRIPSAASLQMRGALDKDQQGGGPATVMYPGGSGLIFLTAILTHATLNAAARSSADARLQQEADQVLAPYRDLVDRFSLQQTAKGVSAHWPGLGKHHGSDSMPRDDAWLLEALPVFVMSRDARSLMAEVTVAAWAPPRTSLPTAMRMVKVVSSPITTENPEAAWHANEGKLFVDTLQGLLAEALEVAMADAQPEGPAPQKSVRYMLGSKETIERGQLLKTGCQRAVLRNLRGWLMSVPLASPEPSTETPAITDADCKLPVGPAG